jgi:Spy/CpxP family protein refolding chaperone
MKTRAIQIFILFSVAMNLGVAGVWFVRSVHGRETSKKARAGGGPVWSPLHKRLGTSDEQWKKIEALQIGLKSEGSAVCGLQRRRRMELVDLIAADSPNLTGIRALQDEILAGQKKIQSLVIAHLLKEKELLTPVQRKILFDLMRRRLMCRGFWGGEESPTNEPNG